MVPIGESNLMSLSLEGSLSDGLALQSNITQPCQNAECVSLVFPVTLTVQGPCALSVYGLLHTHKKAQESRIFGSKLVSEQHPTHN